MSGEQLRAGLDLLLALRLSLAGDIRRRGQLKLPTHRSFRTTGVNVSCRYAHEKYLYTTGLKIQVIVIM